MKRVSVVQAGSLGVDERRAHPHSGRSSSFAGGRANNHRATTRLACLRNGGHGREAVELARKLKPDIVILDLRMPELNGLEATRRIKRLLPQTEILVSRP